MRRPAPPGVPSPRHLFIPWALSVLASVPFSLCIRLLANRSYSSGTAEVATKTATSWSNAPDAPKEDQCGLFDVGAPRYDQCGPLDAPNDNQCAPNEPVIASSEASAAVQQASLAHHCPKCSP